jgi:hypothetical protein
VLTSNVAVMMTMCLMGSSIARRVSPRFVGRGEMAAVRDLALL